MTTQHTCLTEMNDLLREYNTQISGVIDFSGLNRELVQISTAKFNDKIRKKPRVLFATHCPFCGIKLKGI